MTSTPSPRKSLFQIIIELLTKLFGRKKPSTTTPSSSEPSSTSPTPTTPSTPHLPTNPSAPAEADYPLDEATFRYGSGNISIAKSKEFIAVQQVETRSLLRTTAARDLHENLQGEIKKVGDFDLVESAEKNPTSVEETLDAMRKNPAISVGTHVFHNTQVRDATPLIPTGELYIKRKPSTSDAQARQIFQQYALEIAETRSTDEYIVKVTSQSPNPIKITVALQQSNMFDIAEPELATTPDFFFDLPSDELFKDQWHLENKGNHGKWGANSFIQGADAKVVEAWKYLQSLGSKQIIVAVIDAGFDLTHHDLRGDGDKIVKPWDFESDTPDASPRTGNWHGTPCAGVAVAAADGRGTVGACPNARLMPLRFSYISDTQIEKWFKYALDNGADVISNSWGANDPAFRLSTRMINAIQECASKGRNGKGTIICFAAGNSNQNLTIPGSKPTDIMGFATHPAIIAVAASNSKDEFSSYSNYGKQIWVCAPSNGNSGAGVTAPDVSGTIVLPSGGFGYQGYDAGDYTNSFGGTSSACPLVAGICALILSANPNLTATQVRIILRATADRIGGDDNYDTNKHSSFFGYGKINALNAVKMARSGSIPDLPTPIPVDTGSGNTPNTPTGGGGGGTSASTPEPDPDKIELITLPFEANQHGNLTTGSPEIVFRISLSNKLVIKIDSPVGDQDSDFDLYVRRSQAPTRGVSEKSSNNFGSEEKIEWASPPLADYYSLITTYQGAGGYNFEASLHPTAGGSGTPLILRCISGGMLNRLKRPNVVYKNGTSKQLSATVSTEDGSSDMTVYIKRGAVPRWNDYDDKASLQDSNGEASVTPQSGDYYVLVRGSGNYNLRIMLT